jgi:hypothetical protein
MALPPFVTQTANRGATTGMPMAPAQPMSQGQGIPKPMNQSAQGGILTSLQKAQKQGNQLPQQTGTMQNMATAGIPQGQQTPPTTGAMMPPTQPQQAAPSAGLPAAAMPQQKPMGIGLLDSMQNQALQSAPLREAQSGNAMGQQGNDVNSFLQVMQMLLGK